jgi:hypothetical protein
MAETDDETHTEAWTCAAPSPTDRCPHASTAPPSAASHQAAEVQDEEHAGIEQTIEEQAEL